MPWQPLGPDLDLNAAKSFHGHMFSDFEPRVGINGPDTSLLIESAQALTGILGVNDAIRRTIEFQSDSPHEHGPMFLSVDGCPDWLNDLPFEHACWGKNNLPGCLDRSSLLIRQTPASPSNRGVIVDDEVRALIVHGPLAGAHNEVLQRRLGNHTTLWNPTWDELKPRLETDDFNVLVLIGHTHVEDCSAPDRSGLFALGDTGVSGNDLAKSVRLNARIRCVVLLGCQTWSALAPQFIMDEVPAVIGTHYRINEDGDAWDRWYSGAAAFLNEAQESGDLSKAYLSLRRTISNGRPELAGYLAMHVFGESLQLIANEPLTKRRIAFARRVMKKLSHVRVPLGGEADDERFRRQTMYQPRHVSHEVSPKNEAKLDAWAHRGGTYQTTDSKETHYKVDELEDVILKRLAGELGVFGIKASAGLGKTALLHNLTYRLCVDFLANPAGSDARLPLYAELSSYRNNNEEFLKAALRALESTLNLNDIKDDKRFVLILDGLDEMSAAGPGEARTRTNALSELIEGNSIWLKPAATLVSTRPEAAERFTLKVFGDPTRASQLEPWTAKETHAYVTNFFTGNAGQGTDLIRAIEGGPKPRRELARQPFGAWLLCELMRESGDFSTLPTTTTGCLNLMVRKHESRLQEEKKEEHLMYPGVLDILGAFAFAIAQGQYEAKPTTGKHVIKHISPILSLHGGMDLSVNEMSKVCLAVIRRSGFLRGGLTLDDEVAFLETKFREFFVGSHLNYLQKTHGWDHKKCINDPTRHGSPYAETVAQFVSRKAWDEADWSQPIIHLAGLMDDPSTLLKELLK